MTPILIATLVVALWTVALITIARRMRHRLPPPDAPSDHYDHLAAQLRRAHEQSATRTSALYRDLESIRTGRRGREN
jgi:hypothetical protein